MTLFGPSSITSIIGFLQGNQLYSGNGFYFHLQAPVQFVSPYRSDSMGVIYNKGIMMIGIVIKRIITRIAMVTIRLVTMIFRLTGKNKNKSIDHNV